MMVVAVDLRHPYQPSSIEIAGLWARLQQLVGQPFLFFRLSYGEELTAHLGTPKEAMSPKLRSRVRGSYVLTFRGSLWSLSSGPEQTILLADPFSVPAGSHARQVDIREIEKAPIISRNAPVITASPFIASDTGGIGLLLSFADQTTLVIRPSLETDVSPEDLPQIADWELFTQHGKYLRVGPGLKSAYLPSGS
jgi:hypothetical protein